MTPEAREEAFTRQRAITASVLRVHRTANRARMISGVVAALSGGAGALIVRAHAWPWLPLPLAVALGAALAAREVQRRALERHRRACAELVTPLGYAHGTHGLSRAFRR